MNISKTLKYFIASVIASSILCSIAEAQQNSKPVLPDLMKNDLPPAPVATEVPETVYVQFSVGIIKGDGTVVPAARRKFTFYNQRSRAALAYYALYEAKKNNQFVNKPKLSDPQYYKCSSFIGIPVCETDFNKYKSDSTTWAREVAKGATEAISKLEQEAIHVLTDLNGNATIQLPIGFWYVSGSYSLGANTLVWREKKIEVTPQTKRIELSNDNGNIFPFGDTKLDFAQDYLTNEYLTCIPSNDLTREIDAHIYNIPRLNICSKALVHYLKD